MCGSEGRGNEKVLIAAEQSRLVSSQGTMDVWLDQLVRKLEAVGERALFSQVAN